MTRTFSILLALFSLQSGFHATATESCPTSFAQLGVDRSHRKIETIDDLLSAFSSGLTPDLENPAHRAAFEIYRHMRFGDPNTSLSPNSLKAVADALKQYPKLKKEAFRNIKLEQKERSYPVTKELAAYLDSQVAIAGQTRANLFQVEANSGYWKKLFHYQDPSVEPVEKLARGASDELKGAYREKAKLLKEEAQAKWLAFLNQKLPLELRAELLDSARPASQRAKALYRILAQERETLLRDKKDIRAISQAMVDLIHTVGYHDPALAQALRSADGMERLNAYKTVLDERDRFAMELGFPNHFDQVLKDIGVPAGVKVPTGVPSSSGTTQLLGALEEGVMAGSQTVSSHTTTQTVRHLSLVESPFRSCLGGSDCSSRTYLTRALDPNYHYFTLTDEDGASSGQITIVLGEGKLSGKPVKMAFVDKIQNVPNPDLPAMLEGIRRSVEEKNYLLALPDELGDHNGLSNEEVTRSFVSKKIAVDYGRAIESFAPHPHSFDFPNKYSRAGLALPSHAIAPLILPPGVVISPGELSQAWHTGALDLQKLIQRTVNLKNSARLEDQLRYLPLMSALGKADMKIDPEFDAVLENWLTNPEAPLQLRKQVLLYRWLENAGPYLAQRRAGLPTLLKFMNVSDRTQLLQNLLDTPKYRNRIFNDMSILPPLIVSVRGKSKVRQLLLEGLLSKTQDDIRHPIAERVLEAEDISNDTADDILVWLRYHTREFTLADAAQLLSHVGRSSVAPWTRNYLAYDYLTKFSSESGLSRALSEVMDLTATSLRDMVNHVLAQDDHPDFRRFQVLKAYQEIAKLQERAMSAGTKLSVEHAALTWLQNAKADPELKAVFLFSHLGSRDRESKSLYLKYQRAIPAKQYPAVKSQLDLTTNLNLFEKFAQKTGFLWKKSVEPFLYEAGTPESFRFESFQMPNNTLLKDFAIQAAPVTDLQWALVMKSIHTPFDAPTGSVFELNGKNIRLHPERPVNRVTWKDIHSFIEKLNAADARFEYRLPTEEELKYAAKAGAGPLRIESPEGTLGEWVQNATESSKSFDVRSARFRLVRTPK